MSDKPLTHILRSPLPWRDSDRTECGRLAAEFAKIVDWQEARVLAKKYGRQRFTILFCVTCTNTTTSWPTWDIDPIERLGREARRDGRDLVNRELRAMSLLVDAHREEFDEAVAGLKDVTDIRARDVS